MPRLSVPNTFVGGYYIPVKRHIGKCSNCGTKKQLYHYLWTKGNGDTLDCDSSKHFCNFNCYKRYWGWLS